VNPPGHVSFHIGRLPQPHELSAMVMELGLSDWNCVMTLQEAMAMAREGR